MGSSFNITWRTALREAQSQQRTLWILSALAVLLTVGTIVLARLSPARSVQPQVVLIPVVVVLFGLSLSRGLLCRRDSEALDRRLPGARISLFAGKLLFLFMMMMAAVCFGSLLAWVVGLCMPPNHLRMLSGGWIGFALYGCVAAGLACLWTVFSGSWMRSQRLALVGCFGLWAALLAPLFYMYFRSPGILVADQDRYVLAAFGAIAPLVSSWAVWRWMMGSADRRSGWVGAAILVLCLLPFGGYVGHRMMNWWQVEFDQEEISVINAFVSEDGTKAYVTLMRHPIDDKRLHSMWRSDEGWNLTPTSAGVIDLVSGETWVIAHSAMWAGLGDGSKHDHFPLRTHLPVGGRNLLVLWSNESDREHQIVSTATGEILGLASDKRLWDSLRGDRHAQAFATAPYRLLDGRRGWVFEDCWYEQPKLGWEPNGTWPESSLGPDRRLGKLRNNLIPRMSEAASTYDAWMFEPNSKGFVSATEHQDLWVIDTKPEFWLARPYVVEKGSMQRTDSRLYLPEEHRLFSPKGLLADEEVLMALHDGSLLTGRRQSEGFEGSQHRFRILWPSTGEAKGIRAVGKGHWEWTWLQNELGSAHPLHTPNGDRIFGIRTTEGHVWARVRADLGILDYTPALRQTRGSMPLVLKVDDDAIMVLLAGRSIQRLTFGRSETEILWKSNAPKWE